MKKALFFGAAVLAVFAACSLPLDTLAAEKLKIPLLIDKEVGPDWGHCSLDNWYAFEP
jgi:hypothetical protein